MAVDLPRDCYQRATALVTGPDGHLLVFDHVGIPDAGTQVPAGGIKAHETAAAAVVRELSEESGVTGARLIRKLGEAWHMATEGAVPVGLEEQVHHAFHLHLGQATATPEWEWDECSDGDVPLFRFRFRWVDFHSAARLLFPVQALWLDPLRSSWEVLAARGRDGNPHRETES